MALREIKGKPHEKIMIVSGVVSTDREGESDLGGRLVWYLILALVVVSALVMVTAPLWMNVSH